MSSAPLTVEKSLCQSLGLSELRLQTEVDGGQWGCVLLGTCHV